MVLVFQCSFENRSNVFLCTIQDIDMYYDVTDTPAMARTSNLNEELGQVNLNKLNLCCGLMVRYCTHDTLTPIA